MKVRLPFVAVIVSCLLILTSGIHGNFNNDVALFVFGDSIFDAGNNNYINTTTDYQTNYWPYGESYFNPPSGRETDGRIIPDFIAEYARLPLIPAYLDPLNNDFSYGANFASGGAGALDETNVGFVVTLKTQLQYFGDLANQFRQKLGDEKAEQLFSDSIYLFSSGGNDYVPNEGTLLGLYTHEQLVKMVIGNMTQVFKGIYEKGGRKIGILMLPPLACMPGIRLETRPGNISCNEELGIISNLHNLQLSKKLQELETQLEGFMYSIFDFNNAISNRMINPSKYGFKVGDSACCGTGPFRGINTCGGKKAIKEFELCDNANEYLFFDSYHVNEVAYRQFAELFWNGDSNDTKPYNLKTLFQGRNPGLLSSV